MSARTEENRFLGTALGLAAAAFVLYMGAASVRDFWSPDEPDFAEAVREMKERGSFLLPYQNGVPYSEKPILFYWAVAATLPLGGGDVDPVAARVPSALGAAGLVFGAAAVAGRRGGRREAALAGAMTATASIVFWQGQFLQIDAMFSALVFAALCAQLMVEEDRVRPERWVWAFHILLPLAVLTKGPLALVLTGLVALVRAVWKRSLSPILDLAPIRGAAIFVAIVVPWYVLASRAGGPAYTYDLIVNQNWNRFFTAFDHIQPWWFYLESIWGDFSPWTVLAIAAPFVLAASGLFAARPELLFSMQVVGAVFIFLSSSESKQGKYLLVVYPFAAVLAAAAVVALERRGRTGLRWVRRYLLLCAAVVFGAGAALVPVAVRRAPAFRELAPLIAIPLVLGGAGTAIVLFRRRKEAAPAVLALAAGLGATEACAALAIFPAIDSLKTGRPFYERIAPVVRGDRPLAYFGGTYRCYPILVLRRRTEHFRKEADLAAWLQRTPAGYVLADESESRSWTDPLLKGLKVVDRQPVGGDTAQLLSR